MRVALEALAAAWADQPSDYDEDTEQQIEDGKALREVLAAHPASALRSSVREEIRGGINRAVINGAHAAANWSPSDEVDRITDAVMALIGGNLGPVVNSCGQCGWVGRGECPRGPGDHE